MKNDPHLQPTKSSKRLILAGATFPSTSQISFGSNNDFSTTASVLINVRLLGSSEMKNEDEMNICRLLLTQSFCSLYSIINPVNAIKQKYTLANIVETLVIFQKYQEAANRCSSKSESDRIDYAALIVENTMRRKFGHRPKCKQAH